MSVVRPTAGLVATIAIVACSAFAATDDETGVPIRPEDVDSGAADGNSSGQLESGVDAGCRNYALQFSGGQFLTVDDAPELEGTLPITVEAWVQLASTEPSNEMDIFAHYVHPGNGWRLFIGFDQNNLAAGPRAQFRFYDGAQHAMSGGKLDSNWTHLAAVVEAGGAGRLYVNGEKIDQGLLPSATNNPSGLRIGGSNGSNFRFKGLIDELRITRGALYDATFQVPRAPYAVAPETVALWHFDEGEGFVTADATGAHPANMPPVAGERPAWVAAPCIDQLRP